MTVPRAGLLVLCLLLAAPVALAMARLSRPGGPAAQRFGRLFCRLLLGLLRIRVEVTGSPPPAGGGRLLVSNHVSWIDPLVLFATAPSAILAKREVGSWPVIGALARLQATVLVDRTRRMRIPAVNRTLAARLADGCNVLLFPEGTTHDGTRRGRFLTSHLACLASGPDKEQASVQVAALAYSDPSAAWIGDATLLPHLWLVLRNPGMTCRVAFGQPAEVPRRFDRKALGRGLAAEVEALLAPNPPRSATATATSDERSPGLIMTQA